MNMDNQERNRDSLIEHIAEQDRIIRRRNQQIANQAHNARETQRALEEIARERDEARRHECSDLDAHWRLDEALETIPQLARERDEARATKNMHKARADEERARADAAELRPLSPDDVRRALDVAVESFASSCPPDDEPYNAWKVRQATWEALRELFPNVPQSAPARPEGAEGIEAAIRQVLPSHSQDRYADLADKLAERGVRVVTEGEN